MAATSIEIIFFTAHLGILARLKADLPPTAGCLNRGPSGLAFSPALTMPTRLKFALRRLLPVLPLACLAACSGDETISAFADPEAVYALQEVDGAPWTSRGTIAFPEPGVVTGQAPCNRYNAAQTAPYPWFELGPVAATLLACEDLAAEGTFLASLAEMTIAEVSGDTVILSNDAGRQMVFRADPSAEAL